MLVKSGAKLQKNYQIRCGVLSIFFRIPQRSRYCSLIFKVGMANKSALFLCQKVIMSLCHFFLLNTNYHE